MSKVATAKQSSGLPLASFATSAAMLVAGGALAYVVHLPAHHLANAVEVATDGHVQLTHLQGNVWNGSALINLKPKNEVTGAVALPSRFSWSITPSFSSLAFGIKANCCIENVMNGSLSISSLKIENTVLNLPIGTVASFGAPFNTLGLNGAAQLRSNDFAVSWNQGIKVVSGNLEATLKGVSTKLTTLPEIGTYTVLLHEQNDTPAVSFTTKRGPLQIEGKGTWVNGAFAFRGVARSTEDHAQALANLLTLIGESDGRKTEIRI